MNPKEKLTQLFDEYRKHYGLTREEAVRAIRVDLQEINYKLGKPWRE